MITVGYGDVTPVSLYEKIYVIIMTFVSSGIFAYTINKVGSIVNDISEKQLSNKNEYLLIINYM